MKRRFIWEQPGWPTLTFDLEALREPLERAVYGQGQVAGVLRGLGASDREQVEIETLAGTAIDTSEIEGEHLSAQSVRASLARRLDLTGRGRGAGADPRADGVVDLTVDAIRNAGEPLTKERLVKWQTELFPDAPRSLTVGRWRQPSDDPMRVVSGPVSARVLHFEAPPAARIDVEMEAFLTSFESAANLHPLVHAAIAHLQFLTIHPFADGNGRIGRAIADLALARGNAHVAPYVSLSRQIRKERAAYYDALERAQRGELNATSWIDWFISCYLRAVADTLRAIDDLLRANRFWREYADVAVNARQRKVLERYLAGDFTGWLNSRNYTAIAKTSTDTAQRDLADLVEKKIIVPNDGKARKTSYRLTTAFEPQKAEP